MNHQNPLIDKYLVEGCGRCPLGNTPQCKVNNWKNELIQLRRIVLETGLTEELKWGVPVYTFQNKNIIIVSAFKEYCVISFLKGVLLADTEGILVWPGENSQSGKIIKITNVKDLMQLEPTIKAYIHEAIEVEKAGLKVAFKKELDPLPVELQEIFDKDPTLKIAFESLTPGRQRGYIIFFKQPKQSKTRISRIEKCIPKILIGKGMLD